MKFYTNQSVFNIGTTKCLRSNFQTGFKPFFHDLIFRFAPYSTLESKKKIEIRYLKEQDRQTRI
jgi:hypothetical protein